MDKIEERMNYGSKGGNKFWAGKTKEKRKAICAERFKERRKRLKKSE